MATDRSVALPPLPGPLAPIPLQGPWGAAATRTPGSEMSPRRPIPRPAEQPWGTHRLQPAKLRPHSAPGPEPRTCCSALSPQCRWAYRFVAMSPSILEMRLPAARVSARLRALRAGSPGFVPLLAARPGARFVELQARCLGPGGFKKGAFGGVRAYPGLSSNRCNFRSPRSFIPIPANSGLAEKKKKIAGTSQAHSCGQLKFIASVQI
jgi:hypothetical protein